MSINLCLDSIVARQGRDGRRSMIIQIYEIQTPEEAMTMIRLGVDHIGSVIESNQPNHNPVLKETIKLVQAHGRKSSLIPLFNDTDAIIDAISYYRPDIIHFCDMFALNAELFPSLDSYREGQIRIRDRFPELSIMRSIPIGLPGASVMFPSLRVAAIFEPFTDLFLTDTLLTGRESYMDEQISVAQPVDGFVGITGRACDWAIARQLVEKCRKPVILAGGIGPGNAAEGIKRVKPFGIDSCTLTNAIDQNGRSIRFQKDPAKVKDLVRVAHRCGV